MTADLEQSVWLARRLDGGYQRLLKLLDAGQRGSPATDIRRLDNDKLYVFGVFERPRRTLRKCSSRSVKEKLFVLLRFDGNAVTKFPIQKNNPVTDAAKQVSRAEHARQQIAKAHMTFGRI